MALFQTFKFILQFLIHLIEVQVPSSVPQIVAKFFVLRLVLGHYQMSK